MLDVYIELANNVPLNELVHNLRALNLQIEGIQFEPDGVVEDNTRAIVFTLKSSKKEDHQKVLAQIKGLEGIVHLEAL